MLFLNPSLEFNQSKKKESATLSVKTIISEISMPTLQKKQLEGIDSIT